MPRCDDGSIHPPPSVWSRGRLFGSKRVFFFSLASCREAGQFVGFYAVHAVGVSDGDGYHRWAMPRDARFFEQGLTFDYGQALTHPALRDDRDHRPGGGGRATAPSSESEAAQRAFLRARGFVDDAALIVPEEDGDGPVEDEEYDDGYDDDDEFFIDVAPHRPLQPSWLGQ